MIAAPRPRANPFCGPSDTTFRFALVVTAAGAASAFAWDWLWLTVNGDRFRDVLTACERRVGQDVTIDVSFGGASDRSRSLQRCLGSLAREQALWSVLGVVAVVLGAIAITALLPRWKTYRRRLRPVAERLPAIADHVRALAASEGLPTPPDAMWNRGSKGGDALAFGVPGHYRVALGPALVARAYTDRPAFDAVVRHELAHIANRDVFLTYFANAIWYSWCLLALLPVAINALIFDQSTLFPVGWRTAVMAAVIYLSRNALLRAREHYADVRASRADGQGGGIAQVLSDMAARAGTIRRGPIWEAFHWHPSASRRLAVVRDPTPLLRLGALDAFAAGVVGGIAVPTVSNFILHLAGGSTASTYAPSVGTAVCVAVLGGVLGAAVWRSRVAIRTSGPGGVPPALVALSLAAGVLVAQPLSLSASFDVRVLPGSLAELGALAATLVVVTAVYLWAIDTADAWLEITARPRRLLVPVVAGTALALAWGVALSLALADLTHQLAVFDDVATLAGLPVDDWHTLSDLFLYRGRSTRIDWVVWAGMLVLPFGALAWRRRWAPAGTAPDWAFLALPPPGTAWRRLDDVRPAGAALLGMGCGLAGAAVAVAARLISRGLVGSESGDGWRKLRLVEGSTWIGVGAVLVAAAVTAARARRMPTALGLLAGAASGLAATVGILTGWAALGDNVGGLVSIVARPVLGIGLFAALFGASVGVATRAAAAAIAARRRPERRPAPAPGGWVAVGLAGLVALATAGASAAFAGGTAPVDSDFRDYALSGALTTVIVAQELEQQLQNLPGDRLEVAHALRENFVPEFRALRARGDDAVTLTRPVSALRDRCNASLDAVAGGLEDYATALEHGEAEGASRTLDAVRAALGRLDSCRADFQAMAARAGITG